MKVENDFFIAKARQLTPRQRKTMIKPKNRRLSISRQCKILNVNRSSYYYRPRPIKQEDLDLMRKIDELYLENPSSGSRTIRRQLKRQGVNASRKKDTTVDALDGNRGGIHQAQYQQDLTPSVKCTPICFGIWPSTGPNQVLGLPTSPISPWIRGSCILWRLWTGTAARFYPGGFPIPWIRPSALMLWKKRSADLVPPKSSTPTRAPSFTSKEFTQLLKDNNVAISMDGRGRCHDNIFVETAMVDP